MSERGQEIWPEASAPARPSEPPEPPPPASGGTSTQRTFVRGNDTIDRLAAQMTKDEQERRLNMYRRHCAALQQLLTCYRMDNLPSERLFKELEITRRYIDHKGAWIGQP